LTTFDLARYLLLPLGSKGYAAAPWDSRWQLENLMLTQKLTAQKAEGKENRERQTKEGKERKARGF